MIQVDRNTVEVVHPPGTDETGRVEGIGRLRPGRFRIEHGVIDNELAAPGKQVQQGDLPALAFEGVVLVDQLPRKLAALATQLVAEMGELLFLGQVLLTRGDPFFVLNHRVSYHRASPHLPSEIATVWLQSSAPSENVQPFSCK